MLITLCSVCVLASGRVIGDTTVINCLGQTSSPSSRSSSHGCRHPRRHRPHHPRHRQQPNHHHKLHYLQKCQLIQMSKFIQIVDLWFDCWAPPLDVAKSIWVSVDFPRHASCNANQPSRMKSNFDPPKLICQIVITSCCDVNPQHVHQSAHTYSIFRTTLYA